MVDGTTIAQRKHADDTADGGGDTAIAHGTNGAAMARWEHGDDTAKVRRWCGDK